MPKLEEITDDSKLCATGPHVVEELDPCCFPGAILECRKIVTLSTVAHVQVAHHNDVTVAQDQFRHTREGDTGLFKSAHPS